METKDRGMLVFLLYEDTKSRIVNQLCGLFPARGDPEIDLVEVQELIAILDDGLQYIWEDQLKDIETNE